MKTSKIILLLVIVFLIAAFFIFDLHQYLSLEVLKSQQAVIESYRSEHSFLSIVIYMLVYVAVTGLSLPGAAILTLAGGAIFGVIWGTVIVSFASTIGATLAFLAARFLFRDSVIPWSTFTDPEVARVDLNEQDAKEQDIAYEVVSYGIDDLDRAITDSEAHGFVKVLTQPGKDKILGVTIVGEHAGDLIAEFVLAMKHGIGLNKILGTIHIYPTMARLINTWRVFGNVNMLHKAC